MYMLVDDFDMFSEAGNAAVKSMLTEAFKTTKDRDELCTIIKNGIETISQTHQEVYDTAVRECILGAVASMTNYNTSELYPKIMFGK